MPEAGPPSNKFSLNSEESSVIVVTSIRPKGRPLSLRQQRLADFCSSESDRKHLKETSRGDELNSGAVCAENCTSAAVVTMTAPFHAWINQSFGYPLMDQDEDQHHDDVKVLYPPRDLLYSDSDVAVLSSCSSWCVGTPGKQDASPSRMVSEKFSSVDEISPRPYGRVGLVDGSSGIGDRYLNKPPDGFVPSKDMVSISEDMERKGIQKPFRQVWHSFWEHRVGKNSVRSSSSAKKTKPASQFVPKKVDTAEQITASVNNICFESIKERKQRRGVFHPTGAMPQMRVTYRSKTATRSWGRPFYHRAPSMGTRVAQRKGSSMRDEGLEDSVSLFDKKPKPRRCELSDKKNLPRAIVTTATRPGSAVLAAEKESCESSAEPKSAPPNSKRGATENSNNRPWHSGKLTKSVIRPRFSVPIKASRVPMDLLFKEMNAQKPEYLRRDADVKRALKYRGMSNRVLNSTELAISDLNQNSSSTRDARPAVHFNLPERSRSPSLQSGRRLYSPPLHNRADLNLYDIESDMNYCVPREAERRSVPNALIVSNAAPIHPGLKSNATGRVAERVARGKSSPNVPIQNHFYGHSMSPGQSVVKTPHVYNYNMEPNTCYRTLAPGSAMPPLFNDIAVSPDFLYNGKAVSDQAPTAFRFSHPNAPDVLISPPPNPQLRGDTVCVPSAVSDGEAPPVPVYNPCVQTVNIPRYYGNPSPEMMIEENFIPVQPFFPPNVPFRPFMPSVDFSRFEPPPRLLSRAFPGGRENAQRQLAIEENSQFPANLQQDSIPTAYSIVHQNEKTKPFKELLTFSAQVPSSSCIPPKSFNTRGSSSPRLEMQDTNVLCPRDTFKSNLIMNVLPEDSANVRKGDWLDFNLMKPFHVLEPLTKQIRLGANIESGINKYSPCAERTILIKEKEDTLSILDGNVSSWKLSPETKAADPEIDFLQTSAFPLVESVSGKNLRADFEFEARDFDLKESRSSHRMRNSRTCSDTKLSTVTEVSAEVQQPGSCPVTDMSGYDFNPSYASDPPTSNALEAGPKRVDSTNGDSVGLENCLAMKGFAFDTSGNEDVSVSSELLATTETDPYDEGHDQKSPLTGLYHRISNVKPTEKDNLTYPVANSDQQVTDKEKDSIENTTTLLHGILGDNRIATLLNSRDASQSRRRFQSLVARIDNIALHCKLSGTVARPDEDNFSGCLRTQRSCQTLHSSQDQKVERRDAFVQVPVLCSQCVETEPFTAEKGVPDFRAGLTLRIMSTVVDVPPVIKRTESIGTSTEDKQCDEDLPSYTEREGSVHYSAIKHDSKLAINDQLCTSANDGGSSFSSDRREPAVPAIGTDKHIKRLKPFFRYHRNELTNIYSLAAVHSLTVNADKARCSALSRNEKLRTDSNTSAEIRKDKHLGSSDDERNYRCEHEQPGRAPKQHVADRRVSFRPVRRETDIICPPVDACQDERPDQNRTSENHVRFQNDGIGCQVAVTSVKDLRKLKKSEKVCETDDILEIEIKPPSKTADFNDLVDRSCGRSGKKDKSCYRRKSGDLLELNRPSCEDFNNDKCIALKRKPGCALCKKMPSSKKKGILKISSGAVGKHEPPDIPGSIVQFGLSNIVTPTNVDSKEEVTIATATKNEVSQIESHRSRKTVKYIQSVASVIALEASKKSESFKSGEGTKFKDDRSMVIIHDSLAIKNLNQDCASDDADRRASLSYRIDANRSTVPTIFLTRAESNDVPDVESSPTPICTTSMQVAFTSVEAALVDIEDPEKSNVLDRPPQGSPRPCTPSRKVEETTSAQDSSMGSGTILPKSLNFTEKTPGQMKVFTFHNYSKENADCLRETSQPSAVKNLQSDVIETDSEQLLRGCMFTAMRRFMKNRSYQEPCAPRYNQCDNGYPGFQFTGVPVFESECLPLDTIRYCNRCKFKHVNVQDWSATLLDESIIPCVSSRRRTPIRRTTSASRGTAKVCSARDFTDVTGRDKDNEVVSSRYKREKRGCAQNKTMWPSACRERYDESKPRSPPNQDSCDSDDAKSGSSEILRGTVHGYVSDEFCPYVVGGSCPESPQSSKHLLMCALCNKEDCVDKQAHAIRTLPFDAAPGEAFQISHKRCASSLPRSSFSSRKCSARASSAPQGQVRVSSGRSWPLAHSVYKAAHGPRRQVHKHVEVLDCDSSTCDRCEHRKARQRIPSWVCDDKPRSRKEGEVFLVFDDHLDLNDAYARKQCSCRASRKGYGV